MSRFLLFLLTISAAGCGGSAIHTQSLAFGDEQALREAAAAEDKPAILRRERRVILHDTPNRAWTKWQHHAAVAVFPSQGVPRETRLYLRDAGEVLTFRARVLPPGGPSRIVASSPADVDVVDLNGSPNIVYRPPADLPEGTVVELVITLKNEGLLYSNFNHWIDEERPVRSQRDSVVAHRSLLGALRVFNSSAKPTADRSGDYNVYTVETEDQPAYLPEPWAPPARATRPFWVYRVKQLKRRPTRDWHRTWGQIMRRFSENMYDKMVDSEVELDASQCQGERRCIAALALAQVNRDTKATSSATINDFQRLSHVRSSGAANVCGRALYFHQLLVAAGVDDARFAAVGQFLPDPVERFPFDGWFNHVLVVIPGPEPVWIDPSCAWCRPGQLPPRVQGARALVVEPPSGRATAQGAEWFDVTGESVGVDTAIDEAEFALEDDVLTMTRHMQASGPSVEHRATRRSGWTDDDWLEWAATFLRSPIEVTAATGVCDPGQPGCDIHLTAATRGDADTVRVPFRPAHLWLAHLKDSRRTPILVQQAIHHRSTATVKVPSGYVAQLPPSASGGAGPLSWTRESSVVDGVATVEWAFHLKPGLVPVENLAGLRAATRSYYGSGIRLVAERHEATRGSTRTDAQTVARQLPDCSRCAR
jgi:hypothetical protein